MRSDVIDITVKKLAETNAAVKVCDGDDVGVWLPKSQIELEPAAKGLFTVTLPQWLAEDKGLV